MWKLWCWWTVFVAPVCLSQHLIGEGIFLSGGLVFLSHRLLQVSSARQCLSARQCRRLQYCFCFFFKRVEVLKYMNNNFEKSFSRADKLYFVFMINTYEISNYVPLSNVIVEVSHLACVCQHPGCLRLLIFCDGHVQSLQYSIRHNKHINLFTTLQIHLS